MMRVEKNTVVYIRYIMKNGRGEVLENRMDERTGYLHGSSGILPVLQAQLEGLKAGDEKQVYLSRQEGLTDDDFSFEVIIDALRPALPEELALGYLVECGDDCVCYNQSQQ